MTLRINTIQDDVDAFEAADAEYRAARNRWLDAHQALRDRLVATGPVVAIRDGRPWFYQAAQASDTFVDRVACAFAYRATTPDDDGDVGHTVNPSLGLPVDVRTWEPAGDDDDPPAAAVAAHAALLELLDEEVA